MRLALVVVKKDAGRTVELRHDDPLGAVHHERTVHGHQRDFAEVDLLLLDVLDRPYVRLRVDVPDDELNRDLQRRGVGHAALVTLLDVVLRRAKGETDELQRGGFVEVLDREDGFEDTLEPELLAALGRGIGLEELVVGSLLNVDQIGNVDDPFDPAEVPTEAKVVGDLCGHQYSSLM